MRRRESLVHDASVPATVKRFSRRRFLSSALAGTGFLLLPKRMRGEVAPASDWPCHGCDATQTRANPAESSLGEALVPSLELRWEFAAGSGITATPVVVGERVIAGSWDGRVHALDRTTGKELWAFDAGVRAYPPTRKLGVFAAVAVMGERVFVASDRIVALDLASGRPLWQRVIGDPEKTYEYFWAPPLAHQGRVYAGVSAGSETETRGRIVCLDAATGEVVWTFFTVAADVAGGSLIAPPSLDVASGTLYAA
ncbi:MAG: PQQ-binding-like beta-propeller repeat protein, partial [Candidatus Binatia bacterium]